MDYIFHYKRKADRKAETRIEKCNNCPKKGLSSQSFLLHSEIKHV